MGSLRDFLRSLVLKKTTSEGFEVRSLQKTISEHVPVLKLRIDTDTLAGAGEYDFERRLSFGGLLEIKYNAANQEQVSSIRLSHPPAIFYTNGLLASPLSITTYGYWATERVADMLPIDYRPEGN